MIKKYIKVFLTLLICFNFRCMDIFAECSSTITNTIDYEETIDIRATTDTGDAGGTGGKVNGANIPSANHAYAILTVTLSDGTVHTWNVATSDANLASAGSSALDFRNEFSNTDVVKETTENGKWKASSTDLGVKFDNYMNSLYFNGKITEAGIKFCEKTGLTPDQLGDEAIINIKGAVDAIGNDGQLYTVTPDTLSSFPDNSNNVGWFLNIMGESMIDNTDGSPNFGDKGMATAIINPSGELKTRKSKICEDCPDPSDITIPEVNEESVECPPHKSCEQQFGSLCNPPQNKDCPATSESGDCSGYRYEDDKNVMYCNNKIGDTVPGTNGLSSYYCYEYGFVNVPYVPLVVYAGRGFNLSGTFKANETRVCVKDDGRKIYAEFATRMAVYSNAMADVSCKQKEIKAKEGYIKGLSKIIDDLSSQLAAVQAISCEREVTECSESCTTIDGKKSCTPSCSTTTVTDEECQSSKDQSISQLESAIDENRSKLKTALQELKILKKELEELKRIAKELYAQVKEVQKWLSAYSSAPGNKIENSNEISVTTPVAKFLKYSMMAGQVKSISKNSATYENIENTSNSLPLSFQFFIPASVANGTSGTVSANVSNIGININLNYNWSCDFDISNIILCQPDGDCPSGKYNLIFRPISLTNPFPNSNDINKSRRLGKNWNEDLLEKIITNNRDVSNYEVYNLEPMYSITLTPATIKKIRKYNNNKTYTTFDDMECSNGVECRSKFLNEFLVEYISGCGMSNDWNACYSEQLSEYKSKITNGINKSENMKTFTSEGVEMQ